MIKCIECGYLALRHVERRSLDEADEYFRKNGEPSDAFNAANSKYRIHEIRPICFSQCINFTAKIDYEIERKKETGKNWQQIAVDFLNEERECTEFTEWRQGFTPKEHREMLDRQAMLEWQASREERDMTFRQNEAKQNRRYRIIELVLVIITVIAVIAAAFIEKSGQPTINIITPETPETTIED